MEEQLLAARSIAGVNVAVLALGLASVCVEAGEDRPTPLSGQYQALLKEYHKASLGFRQAGTDEARKAAVDRLGEFPPRFVELAEKDPAGPMAVEILVEAVRAQNAADSLVQTAWEMNSASFPAGRRDDSAARAIALLLRDHLRSERLVLVCDRMAYGIRKEYETFLRAVLKTNPHRDVRAIACLALAGFLKSRVQKLDLAADRPELAGRYEGLLGKEDWEVLERQGRAAISGEIEMLLDRALTEYGDAKLAFGGTVGERAGAELFAIRHLAIGKEAPESEGEGEDGKRFKLNDYRGKVVLLYFWSEY